MKWWDKEQTLQGRVDTLSKDADWRPHMTAIWGELAGIRREADIKEELIKEALTLQAGKYEQRLENLNHENARIQEAQAKSVSRELYDAGVRETIAWRETVNTWIATSTTHRNSLQTSIDHASGDIKAVGERITGVERTLVEKISSTNETLAARLLALEKIEITRRSAIGGVSDLGRYVQMVLAIIAAAATVYFLFVPK